jgi:hypothetical protein
VNSIPLDWPSRPQPSLRMRRENFNVVLPLADLVAKTLHTRSER